MVGNPHRWRAAIPQLENRNATAGCLLALLLVAPLLARLWQVPALTLALCIALYAGLVVPLATGILPSRVLLGKLRKGAAVLLQPAPWRRGLSQAVFLLGWLHCLYLQCEGIHITTMQVVFNMAAERVFCPEQRLCFLYVLLFYSVLAYLQRSLQSRPWAQLLSESTTAEFLKLTTAFIIVRLGKGVAMSLVLLTFTLQFNHLQPSCTYILLTFLFFAVTQYQGAGPVQAAVTGLLSRLQLQCLEGMEALWLPVLSNGLCLAASTAVLAALLFSTQCYGILLLLGYTNLYVPGTLAWETAWLPLAKQRAVLTKFPLASWKNPQVRCGQPCAVCLDSMRVLSARCTPCGHVFHGSCLRKCLCYSNLCPLCKHVL